MDKTKLSAEEIATAEVAQKVADDKAKAEADAIALSQDPLKKERERIEKKGEGRTHKEKLLFSKKKIDEELAKLNEDEGVTETDLDVDDAKPLTVGDLKKFRREEAKHTALQMADDIDDEDERELTKHHLSHTIKPSGNPTEDLKNARTLVNSTKNQQIIEDVNRKRDPKNHASGAGAGAKKTDDVFTPTAEELSFMRNFGLTEKDILNARKIEEAKRQ